MFLFWLVCASYQRIATLKGDDEEIDDYKLHVMMKLSIINRIMVTIMRLFLNFYNAFTQGVWLPSPPPCHRTHTCVFLNHSSYGRT